MFKYPYSTTPCVGYNLTAITTALAAALIRGELVELKTSDGHPVSGVFEVPPYLKTLPPYSHPIVLEDSGFRGNSVVIDTRAYTRGAAGSDLKVVLPTEHTFLSLYARLTHRWVHGYANDFKHLGAIVPTMFMRWLSEGIVSKLNLTPYDQVGVTAITGYYFYCLFLDGPASGADKLKIAQQVARHTQIPAPKVLEYIDKVESPTNIHGYIEALKLAVESSRFEKFTPALLYQIMGGSWFASGREVLAVAMEYPPAFYALVYSALNDRSFHKTFFAERVVRLDRQNLGKDFSHAVARFIEV